ncbi:DUF3952 domain-containing protein [Bacillus sp. DX4.1]|uniref:DUF3952 domain-containing protein n=1 Tax=Bacillus sp. DX4.1 TaxID=3055867 RepID=UPI0025A04769|nr:DUF3952 domain-containing protein [Bacillus sp. DX4.1]MDM5188389.1 DUF3952 domain-containing protein [Bacillus sp. DX4.1]
MKLKKKANGMIVMTILATLFGGCSFGETKIEYERLVKALDEGDMKTVISASDDEYASIKEQARYSTFEEKEDGEHTRTIYQATSGIYNTKEKSFYGATTQRIATDIENEKNIGDNKNYKKEIVYSTNIRYENNQLKTPNQSLDILHVKLIFDRLQGISKLKPSEDKKSFSEPSIISYDLTESQFKQLINDKLKLEYDKFDSAILLIEFNSAKDTKENPMEITVMSITIGYEEKNEEGKMISHDQKIEAYLHTKEDNNQTAKNKYEEYKKEYQDNK